MESTEEGGRGESMNIRSRHASLGVIAALVTLGSLSNAQSVRSLVREGNEQYKEKKYNDAEVNYRKALEKEQDLVPGYYNLGNSLYKQNKADEAVKEFESAVAKSENQKTQAEAYYNMGNAFMKGQHYPEAVKSYIESLKLNPYDQDTKYNLSYALEKMRQQQQQQQQQNKNDKNKDKKDQQNDQKQDQNQQKQDQQKQNRQQEQQNQQAQQQKQQSQEKKMAKAEAERILEVLKNDEKDIQRKLRVRPAVRAKTDKDW
jgi:tetratricopeptide (TPR) repeat protein